MTTYLADSNAFSAYLRGRNPNLIARMNAAIAAGELRLSVMVLAELEFGARKAARTLGTTHFVDRVDQLKRVFDVDPIGPEFSEAYARVRDTLEAEGRKIGDRDTIIAAHALSLGAVVVSRNLREFERVPGLKVEDWETTEAGG
jgi:tRNA(fMet)-specific endonuclease VapC